MHLLNKNLPTHNKERLFSGDPAGYILSICFLLVILFGFQSFSFVSLHNRVLEVLSSVKFGTVIVAEHIEKNLFSQEFYSESVSSVSNNYFPEFKQVGSELSSGVERGIRLSKDNFIFGQLVLKDLALRVLGTSKETILENIELANKKVVQIEKKVFPNLNDLSEDRRSLLSSTGVINPSEEATTTATSSQTNQPGWLSFSSWVARPGFIPVVFNSYEKYIFPLRQSFNKIILAAMDLEKTVLTNTSVSWTRFFSQLSSVGDMGGTSDTALREQLKKEILEELQGGGTATIEAGFGDSTYTGTGIVLLKQTGSTTIDLNNVKKIQDSFSDRVLVDFDQAGETGVIQPIFRDRMGEKYNFVITPIKK